MWVEGKVDAGLLAHITGTADHAQGLCWWWSSSMGSHQLGIKDTSVPSPERVALPQHLNQKLAKLWPRTAQPFLLCTRRHLDNVVAMIFWGKRIGYRLYWGHPCARDLALLLVNTGEHPSAYWWWMFLQAGEYTKWVLYKLNLCQQMRIITPDFQNMLLMPVSQRLLPCTYPHQQPEPQ